MGDHTNKQGVTAQGLVTGVTTNSSAVQLHGNPIPEHQRPGFYGPGRPFGHSAGTLVPGDGGGNQVQTVANPAGTSGGGAEYPNSRGANAVLDPLVVPAWNGQTSPGQSQQLVITSNSQLPSGVHGVAYSGATLAATGGLGARTWALAGGSSLPAGMTLSTAGVLGGTPSTAGSYSMTIRVTDVSNNVGAKIFNIAVS
jgi:Putative Ig domain